MTSPAVVTSMDTDMLETAHLMKEKHITRIPVVENDHVIGLVSLSDIAYAVDQAKAGMDIVLHDLLVGMGANRSA
jgi:predicted transcriptional regulator